MVELWRYLKNAYWTKVDFEKACRLRENVLIDGVEKADVTQAIIQIKKRCLFAMVVSLIAHGNDSGFVDFYVSECDTIAKAIYDDEYTLTIDNLLKVDVEILAWRLKLSDKEYVECLKEQVKECVPLVIQSDILRCIRPDSVTLQRGRKSRIKQIADPPVSERLAELMEQVTPDVVEAVAKKTRKVAKRVD